MRERDKLTLFLIGGSVARVLERLGLASTESSAASIIIATMVTIAVIYLVAAIIDIRKRKRRAT